MKVIDGGFEITTTKISLLSVEPIKPSMVYSIPGLGSGIPTRGSGGDGQDPSLEKNTVSDPTLKKKTGSGSDLI